MGDIFFFLHLSYTLSFLRERQGSLPKQKDLSAKYTPNERNSRIMRNDYEENPSLNDPTEESFSLQTSD